MNQVNLFTVLESTSAIMLCFSYCSHNCSLTSLLLVGTVYRQVQSLESLITVRTKINCKHEFRDYGHFPGLTHNVDCDLHDICANRNYLTTERATKRKPSILNHERALDLNYDFTKVNTSLNTMLICGDLNEQALKYDFFEWRTINQNNKPVFKQNHVRFYPTGMVSLHKKKDQP